MASPELFGLMQAQAEKFSIIDTFLLAAKAGRRVIAFELQNEYWIDIGTAEKLEELSLRLGAKGGAACS